MIWNQKYHQFVYSGKSMPVVYELPSVRCGRFAQDKMIEKDEECGFERIKTNRKVNDSFACAFWETQNWRWGSQLKILSLQYVTNLYHIIIFFSGIQSEHQWSECCQMASSKKQQKKVNIQCK